MATLKTHFIAWKPGTDQVKLVRWPDVTGEAKAADHWFAFGACNLDVQNLPGKDRQRLALIHAIQMIVRDQCEPMAVHTALLDLDEYRDDFAERR